MKLEIENKKIINVQKEECLLVDPSVEEILNQDDEDFLIEYGNDDIFELPFESALEP